MILSQNDVSIVFFLGFPLPITKTKIMEPMVFVDYPNKGIAFLLGFGMAMQHLSKFQ
jgi:hypothetical protein